MPPAGRVAASRSAGPALRDSLYETLGANIPFARPRADGTCAYRTITDMREFTEDDELPGDDVLPGFSIKVAQLFED